MPTFSATKRGYENMWAAATVLPTYKARAQAASKKIIGLKSFYQDAEKATGAAWWWIGCIHYREADCNPRGCLANGDPAVGTGRRTTHVPAGRGPYATFADSAVDALSYEGLTKPQGMTAWYLWSAEKINGFVNSRNSNYIWAGTTKMAHGMWVRDHVFDGSKDDPRPGVAAIMKELFELDPSLEPKAASPSIPIVVGGGASIPVIAGSIHLGDPAYAIGAGVALLVILAAYVVKNSGVGKMPFIFTNWKTSLAGAGLILTGLGTVATQVSSGTFDVGSLSTLLPALIGGIGLLASKDGNVTGGKVKQ